MPIKLKTLLRIFLYIFTASYIILGMLLHVEVSYLVVGKYPHITGDFVAREYSVEFSFFVVFFVFIYFVIKARTGKRRAATFLYWTLYGISLVIFYLFISLHQVEIIHLIQYTGAAILLGHCLDPKKEKFYFGKILYLGTSLGILDELLQYYVVSPGHTYLDFNDFLVNSLGVIGGLLFYYGFTIPISSERFRLKPIHQTKRFAFSFIFFSLITVFMFTGNLQVSPAQNIKPGSYALVDGLLVLFMERRPGLLGSWQKHFVSGEYYALTPLEGMILILIFAMVFSTFDPRFFESLKEKLEVVTNYFHK